MIECDHQERDPAAWACLERTRSAVLNVLVAVGLMIAVSGWLLRGRAGAERPHASRAPRYQLMFGVIALTVASYTLRRVMGRRSALSQSQNPESRFFWSHVLSAVIASLGVPLGLAYGWLIDPRLDAVIPFWILPLTLGSLAWPRAQELDDLERPIPGPGVTPP
jgi:hypothetical protein